MFSEDFKAKNHKVDKFLLTCSNGW